MLRSANKGLHGLALSILLIACSSSNQAQTKSEPLPPTRPAPAAVAPASGVQMLPDFTSLVEREGPAVVNISTTQRVHQERPDLDIPEDDPFFDFFRRFMPPMPGGPRDFEAHSLGSGFIISDDGYVLTNAHVVADAEEVTVKLTDKREFKAKVIGLDRRTDVGLVKIDARSLPRVVIGDPNRIKPGEWVAAIGAPFGFENSITAGIISATGRSLPDENYVPFIQTDVPVNPGNSGGPLFNLRGEVIGINSQIYSRTGGYMGLSFAIPIDIAMEVANQLKTSGKVSRGRLGVQIQELSRELASSFGLPNTNGALVAGVEKGSPAERAGIQAGDVIVKYNGKPIQSSSELPRLVGTSKPGSTATVTVWRKGKTEDLNVKVAELPPEQTTPPPTAERAEPNRLGLGLANLTDEQKRQLKVDHGILVREARGAASRAGIRRGDVILALNDTPITSVAQFNELIGRPSSRSIALLIKRGDNTLYLPLPTKGGG